MKKFIIHFLGGATHDEAINSNLHCRFTGQMQIVNHLLAVISGINGRNDKEWRELLTDSINGLREYLLKNRP